MTRIDITKVLHGAVDKNYDKNGYMIAHRLFSKQLINIRNNSFFMTMAQTQAGMYLEFTTTGNEISFEVATSGLGFVARQVWRQFTFKERINGFKDLIRLKSNNLFSEKLPVDSFEILIDGKSYLKKVKNETIKLGFDNPSHQSKLVKIYFPIIIPVKIRNLKTNGKVLLPENRDIALFLGDSITQGLNVGKSSRTYVSQLADRLNLEPINQGISGYFFDANYLNGLDKLNPKMVVSAFGTNDWFFGEDYGQIKSNIESYFEKLEQTFPKIPIVVIVPLWRKDLNRMTPNGQVFGRVRNRIKRTAKKYNNMTVIGGFDLVPHDKKYYSDGYLHPNILGFDQMTDKLFNRLNSEQILR